MSKRTGDPGYAPGWCIHFRSMQHDTCEKEVNYDALGGGKWRPQDRKPLPCFIRVGEDRSGHAHCEHFRPPTLEEVAAHEAWCDARLNVMRTVMAGIRPWRAAHKGQSASEVVECPACKGRLRLSIAAYNGHVHGRCETPGCVSWME